VTIIVEDTEGVFVYVDVSLGRRVTLITATPFTAGLQVQLAVSGVPVALIL
jgi:hypothetical protein